MSNQDKNVSQWQALDDIVQAALADVISADAQFQLSQSIAWQQFGESTRELNANPLLKTLDFSIGFGRLENLAISELDITLPLDKYRPNIIKRCWWGMLKIFGVNNTIKNQRYRLSQKPAGHGNRIEFSIKVRRNQLGQWETSTQPEKNELETLS